MRRRSTWLYALLGSVIIEAVLGEMVSRAIVVPGGRTFWATLGGLAHLPGTLIGDSLLGLGPFAHAFEYASGLIVWFLVCWGVLSLARALWGHTPAEPGASPNGGPAMRSGDSGASGRPPSLS
jgi:hypothetical protein